jgi:hypothetical protein
MGLDAGYDLREREKKREIKDNSKYFGLRNWKNRVVVINLRWRRL